MTEDLSEVESRLREAYQAVAATTVVAAPEENRHWAPVHRIVLPPEHRRPRRLLRAVALAVLMAGAVATVLVAGNDPHRSTPTQIATAPSTTTTPSAQPGSPVTAEPVPRCGSEMPRPLDLPEGYSGPQRIPSSVDGQLVLGWTSTTGSIVARWPPDPQFREILGPSQVTPDGLPSVSASGTVRSREGEGGTYLGTIVFGLRNVAQECRSIQIDVVDTDATRVAAGIAWLSNNGLFISNVPLVIASEERHDAPGVVGCSAPTGVSPPPNRGGPFSGAAQPTSTEALKAFLDANPSLIPDQYLEVRLPDGSFAYAKEHPMRPGSFVTVIHVVRAGSGWGVDRWQASGC